MQVSFAGQKYLHISFIINMNNFNNEKLVIMTDNNMSENPFFISTLVLGGCELWS